MSTRDIHSNTFGVIAVAPVAITSNTTVTGLEIDRQGYGALEFYFMTGVVTDGDYALAVQHSNTSGSGYTAVATTDLLGALPAYTLDTDDAKIARVGYVGTSRYVRVTITSTNVTSGALVGVVGVLGKPHLMTTPNNTGV